MYSSICVVFSILCNLWLCTLCNKLRFDSLIINALLLLLFMIMRWSQLRLDLDSTAVRRAVDCLQWRRSVVKLGGQGQSREVIKLFQAPWKKLVLLQLQINQSINQSILPSIHPLKFCCNGRNSFFKMPVSVSWRRWPPKSIQFLPVKSLPPKISSKFFNNLSYPVHRKNQTKAKITPALRR